MQRKLLFWIKEGAPALPNLHHDIMTYLFPVLESKLRKAHWRSQEKHCHHNPRMRARAHTHIPSLEYSTFIFQTALCLNQLTGHLEYLAAQINRKREHINFNTLSLRSAYELCFSESHALWICSGVAMFFYARDMLGSFWYRCIIEWNIDLFGNEAE